MILDLQKLNVSVDYFSKDWFDRLFTGYLPYDSVLRVFDSFLCEGRYIKSNNTIIF